MEYPSPDSHPYDDSALGPETFPDAMDPMWMGKRPGSMRKLLSLANVYRAAVILAATLSVGNCANTALRAYTSEQSTGQQSRNL